MQFNTSKRARAPGNYRNAALISASLASLATFLSACTSAPAPATGDQPVEIKFDARVGGKPLKCGESYANVGSSKATILPQDFRIYVSAVRLVTRNGDEVPVKLTPDAAWQNSSVALLDFENATGNCNGNAAMNASVRGTAPAGDYRGLVFEIGVPADLNHKDPSLAAPPLNYTALTWPWRIGYKFTTIDLETAGGKPAAAMMAGHAMAGTPGAPSSMAGMSATGFSIHLGSTDCGSGSPMTPPESPCTNQNRPTYRLERFNAKSQKVVFDLAALLVDTDVTQNAPKSMSGCMAFPDDDDCIAIMDRFGLSFRGKPSAGQKFVKAS